MGNSPRLIEVVCALAQYLRANPLACDSVEGITRWWLAAHPVTSEELVLALSWMMERDLVEQLVAADGRLRYRRRGAEALLDAAIVECCGATGTVH